MPRPFDRDRGEEAAALFAELHEDLRDLVAGAGGSAPYLLSLMQHEADWMTQAFDDPQGALDRELARMDGLEAKELGSGLRQAKTARRAAGGLDGSGRHLVP